MYSKNISSLDGRYASKTRDLSEYFSEYGLMKYRVLMECEFLIFLSKLKEIKVKVSTQDEKKIRSIYENFQEENYERIKSFEATTNHDVKAVEYFIKEELKNKKLDSLLEWVHFGLTSEDTNNCTYAITLAKAVKNIFLPKLKQLNSTIEKFAKENKKVAMLARTHGQPASPTTFGKEFLIFNKRLERQIDNFANYKILTKLNGATGNYNAFVAAFPKVNWQKFTKDLVKHLEKVNNIKLETNLVTAQIEPHDTYAELSDIIRRINTILVDFDQDIWRYISDNYITQKAKTTEVGSSTMPHKVNPIDFENSEGNLGVSNALFNYFSQKLPISRLQRDLSDSTVERVFGTAFGHAYLGYLSLEKGLSKISINKEKVIQELNNHPEVIAEAIQTVLRRENFPIPYEALKTLTRGKKVTMEDFKNFINNLEVSESLKKELLKFTPENYIGIADKF